MDILGKVPVGELAVCRNRELLVPSDFCDYSAVEHHYWKLHISRNKPKAIRHLKPFMTNGSKEL